MANIDLFIDTDGDGLVNAEDPDDNNDGIPDEIDPSPYVYSEAPVLIKTAVTNALAGKQEIFLNGPAASTRRISKFKFPKA